MKQSEEDYVVIVKTLIADRRNMGSSYLGKNYRLKTLESLKCVINKININRREIYIKIFKQWEN